MGDKVDYDALRFGQTLKAYREDAGITQAEIAEEAGLTKNYISSIERGIHKCNAQTFIVYGKMCKVSLDEMADLKKGYNINRELLQRLSEMNEKDQNRVLQMINLMK